MAIAALGISCSPRKNGNTDILLKEALKGAEEAGADTEYVRAFDLNISPCEACGYCDKKGICRVEDDFPELLNKMLQANLLIFSTPIYFMGVSAWGKMIIDRCQCLWARKYVLKKDVRDTGKIWGGMVIAVGGSKSKKMFESIRLTMKYFYDVLEITGTEEVFFNQMDEKDAILNRPEALKEAFTKAKTLAEKLKR